MVGMLLGGVVSFLALVQWAPPPRPQRASAARLQLSSGLTFSDGEQILVSTQKPLGLVLEEAREGAVPQCVVAGFVDERCAVAEAGVRVGDGLLSVNNQDLSSASLERVLDHVAAAPRAVNLRFAKRTGDTKMGATSTLRRSLGADQ